MKKSEVEKTICADTSEFTKTTDLVCLQSKVGNLYVDKPWTVPVDRSKVNNVVDIFLNNVSGKLVTNVNVIASSKLVRKSDYFTKTKEI